MQIKITAQETALILQALNHLATHLPHTNPLVETLDDLHDKLAKCEVITLTTDEPTEPTAPSAPPEVTEQFKQFIQFLAKMG